MTFWITFKERFWKLGSVRQNALLVTADMVELYLGIPYQDGLEALLNKFDQQKDKIIPTKYLHEMAQFALKHKYFEVDSMIKQQVSGTAIATTFGPPYACVFMDRLGTEVLEKEHLKP